jgi:hypothetical protein
MLPIFVNIEVNKHSTAQFHPPNLDPELPANISESETDRENASLPGTMSETPIVRNEGENDPLPDEMNKVECIASGGNVGEDCSLIDKLKNGIISLEIPKGINTRSMHSHPIYY